MKSDKGNCKKYFSHSLSTGWHLDHPSRKQPGGLNNQSLGLLQDGILIYDHQGTICQTNPAASITLGPGESDTFIGKNISEFIPKEFAEEYQSLVEIALISGKPVGPIEMELLSSRGIKVQVRIKLGLLKNGHPHHLVIA